MPSPHSIESKRVYGYGMKMPACACAPPPIELNKRTHRKIQFKRNTVQHTEQIVSNRMCGKIWPLVIKSVAFFLFYPSRADAYWSSRILSLSISRSISSSAYGKTACATNYIGSRAAKKILHNRIKPNKSERIMLVEMALNSAAANQNLHHKSQQRY